MTCPLTQKPCGEDKCSWWTAAFGMEDDEGCTVFMCAVELIALHLFCIANKPAPGAV